ncbi:hypothetical protein F5Y10DRAFT_119477 [Nemania abortiva]|nr:hypothetical protein F5Y10DRAFT_119477 [Nemania abortiva]
MPSMQSTLILATALLGSLLQHAAAAPEASSSKRAVQYPDCIATCMRNSGCFDSGCICRKAADGILSDIVICMNQWCPADVTAKDLIDPLEAQCSLPKAAVQDAEKKGGVADDSGSGSDDVTTSETSTAAKPTATAASTTKGGASDVTMTFDVGSPQTAAAGSATTTVKASISGTLTIATDAATTGLLTDGLDEPATTGSLAAATSTPATSSSSASSASASGTSSDDQGSAAGLRGQASVFGVVAAMGAALALGF